MGDPRLYGAMRVAVAPAPLAESCSAVRPRETVDRNARLARLVAAHFDFIWRLLRRLGFERSEADDAAQEVFLVALGRLDVIAPENERTFLYGTALRVASNARRRTRRQREAPEELLDHRQATGVPPDEGADLARACALLDEILRQLPEELARILILAEIEELEGREIAQLEDIPPGTVASRLRRARELVRKKLARLRGTLPPGEPPR